MDKDQMWALAFSPRWALELEPWSVLSCWTVVFASGLGEGLLGTTPGMSEMATGGLEDASLSPCQEMGPLPRRQTPRHDPESSGPLGRLYQPICGKQLVQLVRSILAPRCYASERLVLMSLFCTCTCSFPFLDGPAKQRIKLPTSARVLVSYQQLAQLAAKFQ
jgi:hypothetical protein